MSQLLEHILNGDYVSANDLFEERMVELQEKKLYESKRMIQAEAIGGRTIAQATKDMQARGLKPRKASDVLPDPRNIRIGKSREPDKEVPREMPRPVSKKEKTTNTMSSYARRAELEKRRAAKIAAAEPLKALRMKKGSEIAKDTVTAATKKVGKYVLGAVGRLSDVAQSTWE